MAGDDEPTESAASRARREPPTIDLPASEVSRPAEEPDRPESAAADPEGTDSSPATSGANWRVLSAVLAIILLAVLAGGAWWQVQQGQSRDADVADLTSRLSAIESSVTQTTRASATVDNLTARVAKLERDAGSPATDAALKQRVDALEKSVNALQDAAAKSGAPTDDSAGGLRTLQGRIDTVEQSVSGLRTTVSRLRDASSDSAELQRTNAQVTALDTAIRSVQQKIDSQSGTAADRTLRGALLAMALRDTVARGAPFAAELNAVKSAGQKAPPSDLEPFATKGLPTARTLSADLLAQIDKANAAQEAAPTTGTILDRLKARASHLIRIRPAGDVAGDDPAAVIDRAEVKARDADVDGALAELQHLPETSRAPFADWIARARARQAALAGAQAYAVQALLTLAQPATRP
jgi:hypothetical protein